MRRSPERLVILLIKDVSVRLSVCLSVCCRTWNPQNGHQQTTTHNRLRQQKTVSWSAVRRYGALTKELKNMTDRPQPTTMQKKGQTDKECQKSDRQTTTHKQERASLRRVTSRPRRPGVSSKNRKKSKKIQKLLKFHPPNPFFGPAWRSPERLVNHKILSIMRLFSIRACVAWKENWATNTEVRHGAQRVPRSHAQEKKRTAGSRSMRADKKAEKHTLAGAKARERRKKYFGRINKNNGQERKNIILGPTRTQTTKRLLHTEETKMYS